MRFSFDSPEGREDSYYAEVGLKEALLSLFVLTIAYVIGRQSERWHIHHRCTTLVLLTDYSTRK